MPALTVRIYRRTSVQQRLQLLAAFSFAAVFAAYVWAGSAGVGISQGFYIAIVLAALSGNAATGVGAGIIAAALYDLGLRLTGEAAQPSSLRSLVHLATYVVAGAIVGYSASRARSLLTQALWMLEDVMRLARRDLDTGALDADGLVATLASWIGRDAPFALLVGDVDDSGPGEHAPDRVLQSLEAYTDVTAELARIGPLHYAVVTWLRDDAHAQALAGELEEALTGRGWRTTFGWAVFPGHGDDSLSLFRAASERLYARRLLRGDWAPTLASAGLPQAPQ